MYDAAFHLISFHHTGLYFDEASSRIRHGSRAEIPKNLVLEISGTQGRLYVLGSRLGALCHVGAIIDGVRAEIREGRGDPCVSVDDAGRDTVGIRFDGKFLSCDPEGNAVFNREWCHGWEMFHLQAIERFFYPDSDRLVGQFDSSTHDLLITGSGGRMLNIIRQKRPVSPQLTFTISGPFNSSWSLAAVNRRLALQLEHAHPGTSYVLADDFPIEDASGDPLDKLRELADRRPPRDSLQVIIHQRWPVTAPISRGDVRLAYFFWEESRVPEEIIAAFEGFDGILTPAEFIGTALVESGLTKPVMNVGYSPDLGPFRALYDNRPFRLAEERPFTFLHISACFPRKGVDVLLRAYARAFRSGDFVRLVIKGPRGRVLPLIEAVRAANPDMAQIIVIDEDLDRIGILELYRSSDVMVLPARGEGYNVPAAEAIAAGLKLIVTGYGGHMQFCNASVARLIAYRLVRSESHYGLPESLWAEPDAEDLCTAMQEAWSGANAVSDQARADALAALDSTAWVKRVTDAIDELRLARLAQG